MLYVGKRVASGSDYLVVAKSLACPVYRLIFFAQMYAVGTCLQANVDTIVYYQQYVLSVADIYRSPSILQ